MSSDDSEGQFEPIFATPFASVDTGTGSDFNERLARQCETRRAEFEAQTGPGNDSLHFRGPADMLNANDKSTNELRQTILGHASRLVASVNSFTAAEAESLRIDARAWCSIVQPDGHIPAQHFSGASWLAVYCAQAGDRDEGGSDAGKLRIHESRLSSIYRDASTWGTVAPYRYGHYSWAPQAGRLVLFPAHVQHEVSIVRSSTPLILVFALLRFLSAGVKDNRYG